MSKPDRVKHEWGFCAICGWTVFCGKCGNNCCNGVYGAVDGKECDACPGAYDLQDDWQDHKEEIYDSLEKFYHKWCKDNGIETIKYTKPADIDVAINMIEGFCRNLFGE